MVLHPAGAVIFVRFALSDLSKTKFGLPWSSLTSAAAIGFSAR